MPLEPAFEQLAESLDSLAAHVRDFASSKGSLTLPSDFTFLDECLLEGILSRVWQVWGSFCRQCVMESCIGTISKSGVAILGLPDAVSEAHVSSAAILAKRGRPPYWGATNTSLRAEPTWGDVDMLANI